MDAKPVDTDRVTVFIEKKSMYKWTYIVQTHVIQGSMIFSPYCIINMFVLILHMLNKYLWIFFLFHSLIA